MKSMSIYEIIGGICLIISGLFLTIVVLMQEGKDNGLSGAIQGGNAESFLNTGNNRTKDVKLKRLTTFFAVLFFIITIAANIFSIYSK